MGRTHHHRRDQGHAKPGKRSEARRNPRRLNGAIPWPALADGSDYVAGRERVHYHDDPTMEGDIKWVEWRHPDGAYMPGDERFTKATKTKAPEMRPGAWFAVVAWDQRDTARDRVPDTRVLLGHLVPIGE